MPPKKRGTPKKKAQSSSSSSNSSSGSSSSSSASSTSSKSSSSTSSPTRHPTPASSRQTPHTTEDVSDRPSIPVSPRQTPPDSIVRTSAARSHQPTVVTVDHGVEEVGNGVDHATVTNDMHTPHPSSSSQTETGGSASGDGGSEAGGAKPVKYGAAWTKDVDDEIIQFVLEHPGENGAVLWDPLGERLGRTPKAVGARIRHLRKQGLLAEGTGRRGGRRSKKPQLMDPMPTPITQQPFESLWTAEQDDLLESGFEAAGGDWAVVSAEWLHGAHDPRECKIRWRRVGPMREAQRARLQKARGRFARPGMGPATPSSAAPLPSAATFPVQMGYEPAPAMVTAEPPVPFAEGPWRFSCFRELPDDMPPDEEIRARQEIMVGRSGAGFDVLYTQRARDTGLAFRFRQDGACEIVFSQPSQEGT